jgi:CspA family cold shock protein
MLDNKKYSGKIIWFSAQHGYGFATWDNGVDGKETNDIFCHFSDILSDGFKTLKKDQEIEFELGKNNRGELKAIEIKPL